MLDTQRTESGCVFGGLASSRGDELGSLTEDMPTIKPYRESAWAELADGLVSAGVVVSGALMLWMGWNWLDPLVSLGIAAIVVIGLVGAAIVHTILRHQNGGTVAVELIGHVHLAQGRDNRTAIAVVLAVLAGLLLGVTDITVPWGTLVISVVMFIVIPLAAALWSLGPEPCGAFPALTYLKFLDQHGMLSPIRPLRWHTVAEAWEADVIAAVHVPSAGVTLDVALSGFRQE